MAISDNYNLDTLDEMAPKTQKPSDAYDLSALDGKPATPSLTPQTDAALAKMGIAPPITNTGLRTTSLTSPVGGVRVGESVGMGQEYPDLPPAQKEVPIPYQIMGDPLGFIGQAGKRIGESSLEAIRGLPEFLSTLGERKDVLEQRQVQQRQEMESQPGYYPDIDIPKRLAGDIGALAAQWEAFGWMNKLATAIGIPKHVVTAAFAAQMTPGTVSEIKTGYDLYQQDNPQWMEHAGNAMQSLGFMGLMGAHTLQSLKKPLPTGKDLSIGRPTSESALPPLRPTMSEPVADEVSPTPSTQPLTTPEPIKVEAPKVEQAPQEPIQPPTETPQKTTEASQHALIGKQVTWEDADGRSNFGIATKFVPKSSMLGAHYEVRTDSGFTAKVFPDEMKEVISSPRAEKIAAPKSEVATPEATKPQQPIEASQKAITADVPIAEKKIEKQVEEKISSGETRTGVEIKNDIISNLQRELDRIVAESDVPITPDKDSPDRLFHVANPSGASPAWLEIEKNPDGTFRAQLRQKIGRKTDVKNLRGKTKDEIFLQVKQYMSIGEGKATFEIPDDGTFTIYRSGRNILELIRRAKRLPKEMVGSSGEAPSGEYNPELGVSYLRSPEFMAAREKSSVASKIRPYITSMRSGAKRDYAILYEAWLESGKSDKEPSRPKNLSAIAAQSVRMEIDSIYKGETQPTTKTSLEIANTAKQIIVKTSDKSPMVRINGKMVMSVSELSKGNNPFLPIPGLPEDKIVKLEAGSKGKNGKFIPSGGEVSVTERMRQGPGAATEGDVPQTPVSEQLTQALDSIAATRPSLKTKAAEVISDRLNLGKDIITRASQRVVSAAQVIYDTAWQAPSRTKFKDWVGDWDLARQQSGQRITRFGQSLERAVPIRSRQEAIYNWAAADGDTALLRQWADQAPADVKKGYEDALTLTNEEQVIATNIRNAYDQWLQQAIDKGMLKQGVSNYLKRLVIKHPDIADEKLAQLSTGKISTNFKEARKRVFDAMIDAEKLGVRYDKRIRTASLYGQSFENTLIDRKSVESLFNGKTEEGEPMMLVSGRGIPIGTDEKPATIVNPYIPPRVGKGVNLAHYKPFDHPAFKDYVWAYTDPVSGRITYVKGDALVHKSIYNDMMKMFVIRPSTVLRPIYTAGSFIKRSKLVGAFHLAHETALSTSHLTNVFNLKPLDDYMANPLVQEGMRAELKLFGDANEQAVFKEGMSVGGLTDAIPVVGEATAAWNEWQFNDIIPRMKAQMFLNALERNESGGVTGLRLTKKLTHEQNVLLTARQANATFGELNYRQMARNPQLQQMLGVAFIAPDFGEAKLRHIGQSFTRYGGEQRMAIALTAATLWTIARVANKALDDNPHYDVPFGVVYNGKVYSIRTIAGDFLNLFSNAPKYVNDRLAPFVKIIEEGLTKRDWAGHPVDWTRVIKDAGWQVVPIPITPKKDISAAEQALSTVGLQTSKYYSPEQKAKFDKQRQREIERYEQSRTGTAQKLPKGGAQKATPARQP